MPDLTQKQRPFCVLVTLRPLPLSSSTSTLLTLPLLSPINQTDVVVHVFVVVSVLRNVVVLVAAAFIYFGSFLRFMHCALCRNLLPPPFFVPTVFHHRVRLRLHHLVLQVLWLALCCVLAIKFDTHLFGQ